MVMINDQEVLYQTAERALTAMQEIVHLSFQPHVITDGGATLPLYPSPEGLVEMARLLVAVCSAAQAGHG